MSYELAWLQESCQDFSLIWPFPQKVVFGVQSCVGSGLPAVAHVDSFLFFFIHILTLSGKPPCIYIPLSNVNERWYTHLNDIKKFTSVTWPGRVDALKASSGPLLTVTNTHGFLLQHSCFQEAVWVALPVLIISKSSGFSIWVSKPIMFDS